MSAFAPAAWRARTAAYGGSNYHTKWQKLRCFADALTHDNECPLTSSRCSKAAIPFSTHRGYSVSAFGLAIDRYWGGWLQLTHDKSAKMSRARTTGDVKDIVHLTMPDILHNFCR